MENEALPPESSSYGQLGEHICDMPSVSNGIQGRRDNEACELRNETQQRRSESGGTSNPYGKTGDDVIKNIMAIEKFAPGYPKRVVVDMKYKNAESMQRFFDWQYTKICEIHGIDMEPVQESIL